LISQIVSILFAAVDVKADLARFLRIEGTACKSPRRAGFDAKLAIGAPVGDRTVRFKRGIGQDGDPAHAGPCLGCDQKTAWADPTPPRQPCRQLVGKNAQKILLVHSVRSGYEEGLKAMVIQGNAQSQGNPVQGVVDGEVEVIVSPGNSYFFVARQLINDAVAQGDPHRKGAREGRYELPALDCDSLMGYGKVGHPEEPRPHATSPKFQSFLQA
jgi:hypothetical protein